MESKQSSCNPFLLFFVIFLTTTTISTSYDRNQTDHMALLSFKSMITQDPYGVLTSWNTSFHFCDWNGVSCGKRHNRVNSINLMSQGLAGYLSPHVGNLSFLRELSITNNSFQGTIPNELGRLSRLRLLNIEKNKFNGTIPTNLSGFSNLEVLNLCYNNLIGSIPMQMGSLLKLTKVLLHCNMLTGGIPPFLGNITSLVVLSLTENPLGGRIPHDLGNLKSLTEFYCGECKLYGTIPHSLYNISLLAFLNLPGNVITGSLHRDIGAMFPQLVYLQLRTNQLTGPLPPSLSNCSKLRILEISENNFNGKLTVDFSKLRDINEIYMGNSLYGSGEADEMKFIDSLANCTKLKTLSLFNCKFQGPLPMSIGNLSHQLQALDLTGNQLYGNLPSSIGNLVGLEVLSLEGNFFIGKIPSTSGRLQKLQYLSLSGNYLSSRIPDVIGNLSLLIGLYLSFNSLEGRIPSSLGNCHHLIELKLHVNNLSGNIPKKLLQLQSLSIELNLSRNNLFGSIPTEVGDLKSLSKLDLSDNNLSGNIPSSLGGCTGLLVLSLKGNLFQGMIPPSLSSLRGLVKLDVSQNNLSGQIPRFLEQFLLEYMNLSYNNFEGEVLVLGVFANSSEFSVLGNRKLCGGLLELGLPKCKKTDKHKKGLHLFVIVILISSTLFSLSCFVYSCCKKKRKGQAFQSLTNRRFLNVSYNQLLKATDGFSEANLIGEGGFSSVYKGILDHDDKFVAVKVFRLQNRGALKSFLAECEAWQSIRHRNLLKIITSCSSVDFQGNDFKSLVYEFMPNGNLHDWLHSSGRTSRLNLLQRITILIDVASALDYLHNRCLTTIVHCDLKPSNILLDDDMVAHVGDFGLSRFLGTYSNKNSSTGIRGTLGYAPPEYGLGSEMTSSGDVYSFGILLLEVMTGKRPTENIFNEGLTLHKFASMALSNHVSDVIDDDLLNSHDKDAIALKSMTGNAKKIEEYVSLIIKIGVACSDDSPSQRMKMENVVYQLQHILNTILVI